MEEHKRQMKVVIDGKVYTLAGEESEEYMLRIASYVNNKIQELKESPSYKKLNQEYQSILLGLNMADDLDKEKEKLKMCKEECEKKNREIYEKDQELTKEKMKAETSRKMIEEYRATITELQKKIMKLETEHYE